jgi:hypothetical protein
LDKRKTNQTMKNNIAKTTLKLTFLALVAAALAATPAICRADDATNTPAATPAPKKHGLPFHGKVASVDSTAMTFTVGTMTIAVTSTTKISKDGQPAVFSDITTGSMVRGSYKKDDSGNMNATLVRIGAMKTAAPASTNAPPAQ